MVQLLKGRMEMSGPAVGFRCMVGHRGCGGRILYELSAAASRSKLGLGFALSRAERLELLMAPQNTSGPCLLTPS